MQSLYVYYKVLPGCAPALQEAVMRMQQQLRAQMPGLAASLHQRACASAVQVSPQTSSPHHPEPSPSAAAAQTTMPLTWMEIYQFNGHADSRAWAALDAALAAQWSALPPGIDGPRHTERFKTLSGAAHQPVPQHPLNPSHPSSMLP